MDRAMLMFTPEQQKRFVEITKAQGERQVIGVGIEKGFLFLRFPTYEASIAPNGDVECCWLEGDLSVP